MSELRETIRDRYAASARAVSAGQAGSCCGGEDAVEVEEGFGSALYADADRDQLPAAAIAASLGCGNPTAVAELRAGERVLDLGSGGGIDVLLSARRVGPTGKAYGLDMTEEMLALARANAEQAGAENVEFLKGTIEQIPLPAATVDVVISNCVVNLSVDKPAVFAEVFRVLAPGGRIGISDVVADDALTPGERAERGEWVGCIAGALSFTEYREGMAAAGFADVSVTPTHPVADGMHSAIVRRPSPPGRRLVLPRSSGRPAPAAGRSGAARRASTRWSPAGRRPRRRPRRAAAVPAEQGVADLVVVGGGQSGLATAAVVRGAGLRPLVLEAGDEPVGSWPSNYDSLALFSAARFSALPGRPFPGDPDRYPTRDEVAAYLRSYADGRTGRRHPLSRAGHRGVHKRQQLHRANRCGK